MERHLWRRKSPFEKTLITPDYIPAWMRSTEKTPNFSTLVQKAIEKPIRIFNLVHDVETKTKWSAELDIHVKDFITFNGLRLPDVKNTAAKDPRDYLTGEMFRDSMRRQLNLASLKVDFMTMKVEPSFVPVRSLLIYDSNNLDSVCAWSDAKRLFESEEGMEFNFVYTLRVLGEDEEEKDLFEYHGPPLALIDQIVVTEDMDIALKEPDNSVEEEQVSIVQTATADDVPESLDQWSKVRKLFQKLLRSDFRLPKKRQPASGTV